MASEDSTDGSSPDVGQLTEEGFEVVVNEMNEATIIVVPPEEEKADNENVKKSASLDSMASEDSTDGSSPDVGQLTVEGFEVVVNEINEATIIDDYFVVPREEEKADNENVKKTASLDPVLEKVASTSNDDPQKISAGVTRREKEEVQESRTESTSEVNVNQLKKESEANLIDDYQKYCGVAHQTEEEDSNDIFLEILRQMIEQRINKK